MSVFIDRLFFLHILETKLIRIVSMQDYRIIIKARDLFFKLGFKLVTMDLLAKDLSISKKTIYKYYQTKDELVMAAIELMHRKMNQKINKVIDNPDINFSEKLTKIFLMIAKKLSKINPVFLSELQEKRADIYQSIQKLRQDFILSSMSKLIDDGKMNGYIRENIDTTVITESYLALVEHFINPHYLLKTEQKAELIYKQIIKILFIGVIKSDYDKEFKKLIELE